jgi:hypothetical protein
VRRYVLAAVAAALLAAAPAGAATSRPAATTSPGIKDAAGDWPVTSQDIVDVRVSTVRSGRTSAVRAVLTLTAAPDGVAQYSVGLGSACDSWVLSARSIGGGDMQDSRLQHVVCGSGTSFLTATPENAPATVAVSGNTVILTAPYALGLRKGLQITSLTGTASPFFTGVYVGHDVGQSGFVMSGDLALGSVDYTLR